MVDTMADEPAPPAARVHLLYHYCRMQLPSVVLPFAKFQSHLERSRRLFAAKSETPVTWHSYFDTLYAVDWYMCCGCLENDGKAWEALFATRTGRTDNLLIDALRARAMRLYPRDEEKQDGAVNEFWSHLIVTDHVGSIPIMARYDGQRPLAPWMVRVFQNWHVSKLRSRSGAISLPEDDIALPLPEKADTRWHDSFCIAAREWLETLTDEEVLLLGLRWRYRVSQREISYLFKKHEGTISRQQDKLRDRCLSFVGEKLTSEGWTGDDLQSFILSEFGSLLLDEPRLSVDRLQTLLKQRGIETEGLKAYDPNQADV